MVDASPESIQHLIENSEKALAQIEVSLPLILETRQAVAETIKNHDGNNVVLDLTLVVLDTQLAENEVGYDLFASLNALLRAKDDYTKRYYMQSLNLCFWEACQLFVGEDGDENGLLSRLVALTKQINQAGCQYIAQHIIDDVQAFRNRFADRELRNITRHYDDPIKMYEKQRGLNNIDIFAKGVGELMAICMELNVVSSFLLKLLVPSQMKTRNMVTSSKGGFDMKGMFNDVVFKAFKEKNLESEVQRVLDMGQKSLDECYGRYGACCKGVELLREKGCQEPEVFDKIKSLIRMRMETLFLRHDIACTVWGYLKASSDQERSQNLRLIHITKQAALTHIYGYNEKAREKSLWMAINSIEGANDGKMDLYSVKKSLDRLTGNLTDDKVNSQMFAHYRYKENYFIPVRLEAFGKMVHLKELMDAMRLLRICKTLDDYMLSLLSYMDSKQRQEKQKQYNEWKGKIDGLVAKTGNDKRVIEVLKPMRKLIDIVFGD